LEKEYTKFQTWTLFMTFGNPNTNYSSRDLLLQCCDSAIQEIKEENIEKELNELVSQGLIADITDPMTDTTQSYQISNAGIIYIRKISSEIQKQVELDKIPNHIYEKQDDADIRAAIEDKTIRRDTIIKSAIKNVSPILEIIKFVLPYLN